MTSTRLALALAALAGLSFGTNAHAAKVGYFEMCTGTGNPGVATAITATGHTPVNVTTLDATTLASIDALFVTNCSNGGYNARYTSNLATVNTAVSNGLKLFIHDRYVTGAATILPLGVTATRATNDNIEIPAGSPITTGVGGTLTATNLDGLSSSSHGYVNPGSLPSGAVTLLTRASAAEPVTVSYNVGSGRVVYSTIPLDCAFGGPCSSSPATPGMTTIYTPNLIAWAVGPSFTTCAAEGYTSATKTTLCHKVCESNLTGTALTGMIKLYVATYKEQPACVR
ncbi:hypothetical protein [Lysobacter xanthus]